MGRKARLEETPHFFRIDFSDTNLICAFSNRRAGNMSLVYGPLDGSPDHRRNFLQELGVDGRDLVCAKQVHAGNISYIRKADKGRGAFSYDSAVTDTDALITDQKDVPLAVFTADCLSIFLWDPVREIIALVHAGWRGTREKIASRTVEYIKNKLGSQTQELRIALGPAIRQCCYEVGEEFSAFFPAEFLERRDGLDYLDLAGINKRQLLDCGIKEENILDCGLCTSCRNQDLFSYRKEGRSCGRMMSVIMLR